MPDSSFVFASESMRALLQLVDKVAALDATAMITGETGSGKEILARTIHTRSKRAGGPWIDFNCAACPELLLESELFGYEPGAFSGATRPKPGLFELASGGSLFLDEIGELPQAIQAKLLRILDGAPFTRLGGVRRIAPDARVIAATNREIETEVRAGRFRADLYYRLSPVRLHVPPLRERREDIAPLALLFLEQIDPGLRMSASAMNALMGYHWPGNIRELRNAITAASLHNVDGCVLAESFDSRFQPAAAPAASGTLAMAERELILDALTAAGGNRTQAAARVGISRRTLNRRLREYQCSGVLSPGTAILSPGTSSLAALSQAVAEASTKMAQDTVITGS
jgi:transcriptional regulator with PAS, ATPase and Fis domain